MDVRANRGQTHVRRVTPDAVLLAVMTKPELRQRRRVGVDTARQQRRGYKVGRRILRILNEAEKS